MSEIPETRASAPSTGSAHSPKRRTVSPRAGWAIAAATAIAVALGGAALLPRVRRPSPPPSTPAAPPPASSPATGDGGLTGLRAAAPKPDGSAADGIGGGSDTRPAASDSAAAPDALPSDRRRAAAADGGSLAPATAPAARQPDAVRAVIDSPDGGDPAAALPVNPAGPPVALNQPGVDRSVADCQLADKDIAREAWRRNWPTICATADGKSAIFLPIKGTLEGETHEFRERPNSEARINLPGGESLLTMRQYKLRRLGFVDLRVVPWEGRDRGTHLRMKVLPGKSEPTFELKDGYAKVTVDVPLPGAE